MIAQKPLSIVGVGEVLWDVFPDCSRLGGAPANFACCIKQLAPEGSRVSVFSAVGSDDLGEATVRSLSDRGLDLTNLQKTEQETGQVLVKLDHDGKATYKFVEDPAWDHLMWNPAVEKLAAEANAICFGTLGQRDSVSRSAIRKFVKACPSSTLKVLDLNLRPPFDSPDVIFKSLTIANALKLNDEELPKVASLLDLGGSQIDQLEQLRNRFQYRFVALTLGAEGSMVLADRLYECEAEEVTVADTVGAGDAFTAALVLGVLENRPWDEVHRTASRVAGYVASQAGATPPLPKEFCFGK